MDDQFIDQKTDLFLVDVFPVELVKEIAYFCEWDQYYYLLKISGIPRQFSKYPYIPSMLDISLQKNIECFEIFEWCVSHAHYSGFGVSEFGVLEIEQFIKNNQYKIVKFVFQLPHIYPNIDYLYIAISYSSLKMVKFIYRLLRSCITRDCKGDKIKIYFALKQSEMIINAFACAIKKQRDDVINFLYPKLEYLYGV